MCKAMNNKKMSVATLSRALLHEGASDFLPSDEFDVTTRMQKRVTEIDGRQSERQSFFLSADSRQILIPSSCLLPAILVFLLSRNRRTRPDLL